MKKVFILTAVILALFYSGSAFAECKESWSSPPGARYGVLEVNCVAGASGVFDTDNKYTVATDIAGGNLWFEKIHFIAGDGVTDPEATLDVDVNDMDGFDMIMDQGDDVDLTGVDAKYQFFSHKAGGPYDRRVYGPIELVFGGNTTVGAVLPMKLFFEK